MIVASNGSRIMKLYHALEGAKMPVPDIYRESDAAGVPLEDFRDFLTFRGFVGSLFQVFDDILEAGGISGVRGDQGFVGREDYGLFVP